MEVDVLFACMPVSDLDVARDWYMRFFGRDADIVPNDDEVMWQAREASWVYVLRDPAHAGHATLTLAVPDLEQAVDELRGRGVVAGAIERVADDAWKATASDPDGNRVSLIEVTGGG